MPTAPKFFTCGLLMLAAANWSAADTLYNATFSSPPNVIGTQPKLGAPYGPSTINFGYPTVQASLGALNRQPLVFIDEDPLFGDYDQVSFGFWGDYTGYEISFDALVADASSSFSIFLDTPVIQRFSLDQDLVIRSYQAMGPVYPSPLLTADIGTYTVNTVMHFAVSVDLPNLQWEIAMNDNVLLKGPFYTKSGTVQDLRFSEGYFGVGTPGKVGIDNVVVIGTPEPSTMQLAGAVIFAFTILHRPHRRKSLMAIRTLMATSKGQPRTRR